MEGLKFAKKKMVGTILGHMTIGTDCDVYFRGFQLDTDFSLTNLLSGLYATIQIVSDNDESCECMKESIERDIRFFITGEMDIDWSKSDIKGTVDYPHIANFTISKFGYYAEGSLTPIIIF